MCQARIVLKQADTDEVVLEDASQLDVTDKGVWVASLFDQPKLIPGAKVLSIDFLSGMVILTGKGDRA